MKIFASIFKPSVTGHYQALADHSIFTVEIRKNLIKTCECGNYTAFRTKIDSTVEENVDFFL